MAAHGARRLRAMARNAAHVVGIELLAAVQGCDFHAPLASSAALESARAKLRAIVPMLQEDRYLHPDMLAATRLVSGGGLVAAIDHVVLPGIVT